MPGRRFALRDFTVDLEAGAAGPRFLVSARAGAAPHAIPAPTTGGYVVVTYTSTLLILVSLSRARVCLRQIPQQPLLTVSQEDLATANAYAPAPDGVFPYDNACIPNYADLAIKLGLL